MFPRIDKCKKELDYEEILDSIVIGPHPPTFTQSASKIETLSPAIQKSGTPKTDFNSYANIDEACGRETSPKSNVCELNYNPIPVEETESQQITFASKVVHCNKLISIQLKGIEIFD